MIVRDSGSSLFLITQPDHAALARRVMERWTPLHSAERRASILLAVEEHDNGWSEPDAAPLVEPSTGRVLDFINIPAEIRQEVWPRAVARLANEDVWAAALVAQHAVTIYDRYRSDPGWREFFPQLERIRDDLAGAAGRTEAQLTSDYQFVRIGDLISLVFCNQWDEPQSFAQWSFRRDGDNVVVSPDGFGGRDLPIAVRARQIPSRRYESSEELQRVVRISPVVTLAGTVVATAAV
jgi:Protein of unknown function (DUF3891)